MKKLIALLLALIMVFSMVACGAKEEAPAAESEEVPATETTPEKEEAPEETPEETPAEKKAVSIMWPETDSTRLMSWKTI